MIRFKRSQIAGIVIAIVVVVSVGTYFMVTGGGGGKKGAGKVVVHTWGGDLGKSFRSNIVKPFEEKTGIKVSIVTGMAADSAAKVRAQASNPKLDVAMMTPSHAYKLYENDLIVPLDPEEIPNINELMDQAIYKEEGKIYFAGLYGYTTDLIYRTDKIDKEINSWKDLWDPAFKGKVMLSGVSYADAQNLILLARAWGGSQYNIDPVKDDIIKLAEMGNLGCVYRSDMKPFNVISSGEMWIGDALTFTTASLVRKGVPIKRVTPKEGSSISFDGCTLVKGAPHPEAGKKFINFMFAKEQDEEHAKQVTLIPANKNAEIPSKGAAKKFLPSSRDELSKIHSFNMANIAKKMDDWISWWEKNVTPKIK